jgi:hypothetical protein
MRPTVVAVGKDGRPLRAPQQVRTKSESDEFTRMLDATVSIDASDLSMRLNPEAFAKTDPVVIELMNRVRALQIELAAVIGLLIKPRSQPVFTEEDLSSARSAIHRAMENSFRRQAEQLGRMFGSKPPLAPSPVPTHKPTDPRRSP